jgi:hypothetical protein
MASLTDRDIDAIARRIAAEMGAVPVPMAARANLGAAESAWASSPRWRGSRGGQQSPAAVRRDAVEGTRAGHRGHPRGDARQARALARRPGEETGLGRVDDKVVKNRLVTEKTPGLEDLAPSAVSGDHGLSLMEPAPFGVIGAITPSTNPTSTIICNAIGMLAAGNASSRAPG